MNHGKRTGVLLAAALLAAATGCSTKASTGSSSSGGAGGTVKTGIGISGTTITLGVLTDLTGVFAALGADITNSQTLFWEQQNAKGGVCGKYQVKLNVKDTGYVPQQGVQLYSSIKGDVLAMAQTIGSPINTALEQTYDADKIVNIPSAWARNLTVPPGNAVTGATYDVEMVNVLDYALKQGKIKEGAKIGHIYFEGEYGANGLAGSKYFASKHGMTVVEAKIKSTDADMTAQVTQFKAAGVNAIALTVAPGQTASAAGVAAAQQLNVPIVGNNPVFSPALLAGPAAAAIRANLLVASPVSPFDKNPQLLADYKAKYPNNANPSLGVVFGAGASNVMKQILEKACASGDLTRDGVLKAKQSLSNVDTGGLVVPLDLSKSGVSPSSKSFIFAPAAVPGGAKALGDATESPDVAGLK